MHNPILQSEGFEKAAYSMRDTVDNLTRAVERYEQAVYLFARKVDAQTNVAGMQAENELRQRRGLAQAYDESAFYQQL